MLKRFAITWLDKFGVQHSDMSVGFDVWQVKNAFMLCHWGCTILDCHEID